MIFSKKHKQKNYEKQVYNCTNYTPIKSEA